MGDFKAAIWTPSDLRKHRGHEGFAVADSRALFEFSKLISGPEGPLTKVASEGPDISFERGPDINFWSEVEKCCGLTFRVCVCVCLSVCAFDFFRALVFRSSYSIF